VPEFRKSVAREYFESIVIAVILALFIRTFVVQAFKIPTGSMEPNLLVGDHLLVNKFVFSPTSSSIERWLQPTREVRRGDIVVFKFPADPERDFIKRVIGLPGETVELKNRRIHINGRPLEEPYAHYLPRPNGGTLAEVTAADVRDHYGPETVPAGSLFVMGDNRDNSQDSRYWGFLPRDNIKGQALVIYWSYDPDAGGLISVLTSTRWGRLLHQIH